MNNTCEVISYLNSNDNYIILFLNNYVKEYIRECLKESYNLITFNNYYYIDWIFLILHLVIIYIITYIINIVNNDILKFFLINNPITMLKYNNILDTIKILYLILKNVKIALIYIYFSVLFTFGSAIPEEIFFRKILFNYLLEYNITIRILFTSILFSIFHLQNYIYLYRFYKYAYLYILYILYFGILMGFIYYYFNYNISRCIFVHSIINMYTVLYSLFIARKILDNYNDIKIFNNLI